MVELTRITKSACRTPQGLVGLVLVTFVTIVAFGGPFVAPHSATEFVTAPFAQPSGDALLGGDVLGRDVFSRLLEGGWLLLILSLVGTLLGVAAGTVLGIVAAYFRGFGDTLVMRSVDVIMAVPELVLALVLLSVLGPELWLIVFAIALSHAPRTARVIRATSLDICERDFVKARRATGVHPIRIMLSDIGPNVSTPVLVEFGLRIPWSIALIAGLSFLGFGLQPPDPNWGAMINENRIALIENPWPVIVPAFVLALLTVGANLFADAMGSAAKNPTMEKETVDKGAAS